jgi:Ca-activated chloride channel family protein
MTRIPSILLCLSMAAPLAAQPLFRSAVDLVTIPVTVTGRDASRPAGELSAADFRIFEDGVAQQIALVSHEPRPISLCILLDSSPSMASGRQALASRTIDALLAGLKQDDEATLLFFASKVRTVFPWTRAGAIRPVSWIEWRVSLGTALVDALREALSLMERASNPVPVILVVSDGGENASRTPVSKLVASRRQSETLVYAVDTELPPSRIAPPVNRAFSNFLPELVGDSGGTIYEVKSPEAGENAARALLDELRAQYTLGYVPRRAADGTFRQIKVESTARGYAVRHRAGYLAEKRN